MTIAAIAACGSASEQRQFDTNSMLAQAHRAGPLERQRLIDEVIVRNVEVARSVASRYRNRGIPIEDLEQVASLGLVRAAMRYDPSKADDFLAYAVPTIRGEVRRYFRDHGWTVRPPRAIQELQATMRSDAADHPTDTETGDAADAQVAARLGVTAERVREARAAQGCFTVTSIDAPSAEGREPLAAMLVDDAFDEHSAVEARLILRTLTQELKPRDRLILYLRFVEGRTQSEIGAEIGVTQMQVSRLLNRILTQMRERARIGASGLDAAS